jgi:hypothetical protein
MKILPIVTALLALLSPAAAQNQGCGAANPRCLVPTAPFGTNNSQAASTAFVQAALNGLGYGNVNGPGTSAIGDVATYGNTVGTLINDTPALQLYGTIGDNVVLAGPITGASAYPTFRALTAADIPTSPSLINFGSNHVRVGSTTAPALSSCGSSPSISGTDVAGQITMGSGSPTSCTMTFNVAYSNAPYCTVTWQHNLASMIYATATNALTLVQTGTSNNIVDYFCAAQNGG